MSSCNFVMQSMGDLRYYIPFSNYIKDKGINSVYFYSNSTKYDSTSKNLELLRFILSGYNLYPLGDIAKYPAPNTCVMEGVYIDMIKYRTNIISFTNQTDFRVLYKRYVDAVDHIIIANKRYAEEYGTVNPKNRYFGSTKYDIQLDDDVIKKKYGICCKSALVLYPKYQNLRSINLKELCKWLNDMGFQVFIKSRGKEPPTEKHLHVRYIGDDGWHPHPTVELMKVVGVTINFDSTAIEEAIMMGCPMLNYHVKTDPLRGFDFMYSSSSCVDRTSYSYDEFKDSIASLLKRDIDFYAERLRHVCVGNSSERICSLLK